MELTDKEKKIFKLLMNDKYSKGAFLGQVGGLALDPLQSEKSFEDILKARLGQLVIADKIYNSIIDEKDKAKVVDSVDSGLVF